MKLTSLVATEVGHAEEHAGDDHEPDHDPGGLHHLPTVRPLYPLQLAPASLQEVHQPASAPRARRRSSRSCGTSPPPLPETAVAATARRRRRRRRSRRLPPPPPPSSSVGQLVVRRTPSLSVAVTGEAPGADRQLRLGQLDVRSGVLERIRSSSRSSRRAALAVATPGRRDRVIRRPARPPFAAPFAVASHELSLTALSAFRDAAYGTCTSGSTCAAAVAPGCSACSYSSGNSGACTPRRRGLQRSGRLHGPCGAFLLRRW